MDEVDEGGAVADLLCLELAPWSSPWTSNFGLRPPKDATPDDQGLPQKMQGHLNEASPMMVKKKKDFKKKI